MKNISNSQMKKDIIFNKYKSKKYIINNITHLVLNEPYNMIIIIDNNQIPLDESGDIISSGINFAPAWVIEILSPAQSQTKVTGNILQKKGTGNREQGTDKKHSFAPV
jgi:Uma2 family endonuclease